ncbi:MAG: hypothetical protein J6T15_02905 [Bacilli bacterium]|nr:hypothetical protein [Bacilli bacterium]
MKKTSKLIGLFFAAGMLLGACDKAAPVVNPTDNDKTADKGNEDNPAVAHEHSFGDWVETPATCAAEGKKERVCACGEKESEILPKLTTHTFGEWQETPATCAADGKKERVCSVCGFKEEETLPKLTTHTFGEWQETPATCGADGKKERVCSVCGFKEEEVIPKTENHNFVDAEDQTGAVPATCKDDGVVITECSVCGAKSTRVEPKNENHEFGEWQETPATYEEDGKKERVCSVCEFKEEEVIPKLVPTWDANDQAILDTYFYGLPVPCALFDTPDPMEYDSSQEVASLYAGNPEGFADKYAALFDESWKDESYMTSTGGKVYRFEHVIVTPDGPRIAAVCFYGIGLNAAGTGYAMTADGSGIVFAMEIFIVNYLYDFAGSGANTFAASLGATIPLPAPENAIYYQYDNSNIANKVLYIICNGDVNLMMNTYLQQLIDAGYAFKTRDQSGYYCFVAEENEVLIGVGGIEEMGWMVIRISDLPGNPKVKGDELDATVLNLSEEDTSFKDYTYTGASGAEYLALASSEKGFKLGKAANAGIVVTKAAGVATGVGVIFNNETVESRGIIIYGSNEPFDINDMYDDDNAKGLVEIGGVVVGDDGKLEFHFFFDTPYAYIGIRPNSGNVYIDKLIIGWQAPATPENPETPETPENPEDQQGSQDPSDPGDGNE